MAKYFCRICDSSNGWTKPSGVAEDSRTAHFGKYGFANEEWNCNPALVVDGYQHGWLEGFKPMPNRATVAVTPERHDIALYVLRANAALLVGKIVACENLSGTGLSIRYPDSFAKDAIAVGGNITVTNDGWYIREIGRPRSRRPENYLGTPMSNMRFRPDSMTILARPVPIPITFGYYAPLVVTQRSGKLPLWESYVDRIENR